MERRCDVSSKLDLVGRIWMGRGESAHSVTC